jgi:hypothetical protein
MADPPVISITGNSNTLSRQGQYQFMVLNVAYEPRFALKYSGRVSHWTRCGVRQPTAAAEIGLRVLQESQIEGQKHQNNADIHHQPFPESIPKKQ